MTSYEFVRRLKLIAFDNVQTSVRELLAAPPGRRPSPPSVKLSTWYKDLSVEDQQQIANVIELTATHVLYSLLLVLDGMLAIAPADEHTTLELYSCREQDRVLLNNSEAQDLSCIFKDLLHESRAGI